MHAKRPGVQTHPGLSRKALWELRMPTDQHAATVVPQRIRGEACIEDWVLNWPQTLHGASGLGFRV